MDRCLVTVVMAKKQIRSSAYMLGLATAWNIDKLLTKLNISDLAMPIERSYLRTVENDRQNVKMVPVYLNRGLYILPSAMPCCY